MPDAILTKIGWNETRASLEHDHWRSRASLCAGDIILGIATLLSDCLCSQPLNMRQRMLLLPKDPRNCMEPRCLGGLDIQFYETLHTPYTWYRWTSGPSSSVSRLLLKLSFASKSVPGLVMYYLSADDVYQTEYTKTMRAAFQTYQQST